MRSDWKWDRIGVRMGLEVERDRRCNGVHDVNWGDIGEGCYRDDQQERTDRSSNEMRDGMECGIG